MGCQPGKEVKGAAVEDTEQVRVEIADEDAKHVRSEMPYVELKGTAFASVLERGVMAVVRAEYFEQCLRENRPFGHRAQIPPEFIIEGRKAAEQWYTFKSLFLVIVSYTWLSKEHPDPHMYHLPRLVGVLRLMYHPPLSMPGVILDFCSFWQGTRTEQQEADFREALKVINVPYGHPDVTALKLTGTPEGERRGYDDRGWTKFESDVIATKAKANGGELNILTCDSMQDKYDLLTLSRAHRRPPTTPERFEVELRERGALAKSKGVDLFTNGKDQPFIISKFREAFGQMTRDAPSLGWIGGLTWGEEEARSLSEVLPHYKSLTRLSLGGISIPPAGVETLARGLDASATLRTTLKSLSLACMQLEQARTAALAPSIGLLRSLEELNLEGNNLGRAELELLAPSLTALTNLKELHCRQNSLQRDGAEALAPIIATLTNLERLDLMSCDLGPAGMAALAPSLGTLKNLEDLAISCNNIQQAGAEALASSIGALKNLGALWICDNDIQQAGAEALAPSLAVLKNLDTCFLSDNNIQHAGAVALAPAVAAMRNLRVIQLCGNFKDNEEAGRVKAMLLKSAANKSLEVRISD